MASPTQNQEQEELSDSENDGVLDEDMEALRRACMITGTNPDDLHNPSSSAAAGASADAGESTSDEDDLELAQKVWNRYSISSNGYEPMTLKPLSFLPPPISEEEDDDDDDFAILRAVQRRFSAYDEESLKIGMEDSLEKQDQVHASSVPLEKKTSNDLFVDRSNHFDGFPDSVSAQTCHHLSDNMEMLPLASIQWLHSDPSKSSTLTPNYSSFPHSAKVFMDAIKKNRLCQKFLRSKLIEIEAKMEENKKLKGRFKILKDFQVSCKKRTGMALSQKKDPRAQLISVAKSWASKGSQVQDKKISAMNYGPVENSHVANYKMALTRLPSSLERKKWSEGERANLEKGLRQQFQEMMLQISLDRLGGPGESFGDVNDLDNILESIKNVGITSENIREFLPKVNWEQLASMYVAGRSGAECEASIMCPMKQALQTSMTITITDMYTIIGYLDLIKMQGQHRSFIQVGLIHDVCFTQNSSAEWLNFEDPLINHGQWTAQEDKNLLYLVQVKGVSNWFDISLSLGTNRTPFQCLARYQRSLNVSILKREWTKDEDAKLRSAVEAIGEGDWQSVATALEGRTGTQCSNRWKKSLHPTRARIGRWGEDEDKQLKVAQMLFGPKNWKKIAQFVPGRTEVQVRERWVNTLDPSLNWDQWTEEEDLKLRAAIAEHGYCWSKVAAALPRRHDNMCRRRWKRLLPHELELRQAARKVQKAALVCNFVDREMERPALSPSDFFQAPMISSAESIDHSAKKAGKIGGVPDSRKKNIKSSGKVSKKRRCKKSKENVSEEALGINDFVEVDAFDGHGKHSENEGLTIPSQDHPSCPTGTMILTPQNGEGLAGPDTRAKRSRKSQSKRKELMEPDEDRNNANQTEALTGTNTRVTDNRKRVCSKRQRGRKRNSTDSREFQSSTHPPGKSLLLESGMNSTESMGTNGEFTMVLQDHPFCPKTLTSTTTNGEGLAGPDTRTKQSRKPQSKRKDLMKPDEDRNSTDRTEPLAGTNTRLTGNGKRACSRQQRGRKKCTTDSGEHQSSTHPSGKSLLLETGLDSTHSMVTSDEVTILVQDHTSCPTDTMTSTMANGEGLVGPDTRTKRSPNPQSKRKGLMKPDEDRYITDQTEPLAGTNTRLTGNGKRACSRQQRGRKKCSTDLGKDQRSTHPSGKSLLETGLDSTHSLVTNDEVTIPVKDHPSCPTDTMTSTMATGEGLDGPDTRTKKSHKPQSKRKELMESDEDRNNSNQTEPLAGSNTRLTENRKRVCSNRPGRKKCSTDLGERLQSCTHPSGNSLLLETGLASTQSMVTNREEIGTVGGNDSGIIPGPDLKTCVELVEGCDLSSPVRSAELTSGDVDSVEKRSSDKIVSKKNKAIKQNSLIRVKRGVVSCSDQQDEMLLASFVGNISKKRKLQVTDCDDNQVSPSSKRRKLQVTDCDDNHACPSSKIQEESGPVRQDGLAVESSMPSLMQDNGMKGGENLDETIVVAHDNEPDKVRRTGGQEVVSDVPMTELVNSNSESVFTAEDISLSSIEQTESGKEHQTCRSVSQACPPSSSIRGSQLLCKRVNQIQDGNYKNSLVSDDDDKPNNLDPLTWKDTVPEPESKLSSNGMEYDNEVGDITTLASFLKSRSKKRQLESAKK